MDNMSLTDWKSKGRFYNYNSHQIFTIDEGVGDVLILIHGFPTASWDWHKMWNPMKKHFRLITLDMIGFGFSDKPQNYNYSIIDQAELIVRLLRDKAIKSVKILAHDYGDSVAQELLARYNSNNLKGIKIESICFLNGGLFPETHQPLLVQRLLMSPVGSLISRFFSKEKFTKNLRKIFGPNTQPSSSDLDNFWTLISTNGGNKVMHRLIRYMQDRVDNRERWVTAMQTTEIPLRLIDGLSDPISGKHMVDRYKELIPNPDVIGLDDIGHFPLLESPEHVLYHFIEFAVRN